MRSVRMLFRRLSAVVFGGISCCSTMRARRRLDRPAFGRAAEWAVVGRRVVRIVIVRRRDRRVFVLEWFMLRGSFLFMAIFLTEFQYDCLEMEFLRLLAEFLQHL